MTTHNIANRCYTLYLANAFIWAFLPPIWMEVSAPFAVAMTCVMGSRLVLNLREAYYLPAQDEFVPGQTNYYDHRIVRTQRDRGKFGNEQRTQSTTFRVAPIERHTQGSEFDDDQYDCELSPISDGSRSYKAPGSEKDTAGGLMATTSYGSSTLANSSRAESAKAISRGGETSDNCYHCDASGIEV